MKDNILFVDDEPEILETYGSIFQSNDENDELIKAANALLGPGSLSTENQGKMDGYRPFLCSQGSDAVEVVKTQQDLKDPIKVAFIDMRMPPGMNGAETAKKIREIDSKVEIVIVTAYSDIKIQSIVEETGDPSKLLYLKKPFDKSEIQQLIYNLTSKYKSERTREDFLSYISHELKTPLSSIYGFSQLLTDAVSPDAPYYSYVKVIESNAFLMKNMFNDLFTMLLNESSQIDLNLEETTVNTLVGHVFHSMGQRFAEKPEIEFTFTPLVDDESINIDKTKLQQCLFNLLNNALKFTNSGHVSLITSRVGDYVSIKVSDSGPGIPKELQDQIFLKFTHSKNAKGGGLGLGLNICKTIIELHSGKISVESTEGEGSTFEVLLPLKNGNIKDND